MPQSRDVRKNDNTLKGFERFGKIPRVIFFIIFSLGIAFSINEIFLLGLVYHEFVYYYGLLAIFFSSSFVIFPASKNAVKGGIPWYDIVLFLATIAACHLAGVEFEEMREPIAEFEGAARRLQLLGEPWSVAIVSDYAHHPNEIRASLAATRQRFPHRRVFCVFQPHQYSRTRAMLPELAEAFRESWTTLVTDIYAARDSEEDRQRVSASDLVQQMNHIGLTAHYIPEFSDIEDMAVGDVVPRDVVLVMGAGNIWQVARNIVPRIAEKGRRQIAA